MSETKDWVAAIRLKTLPASISPVLVASAYAYKLGEFRLLPFLVILLSAMLIQVITNFFNEIYDFKSGADNEERLGSVRSVASGNISVQAMWRATIIQIAITLLAGIYLVSISDYYILLIGIVSLFFSWAYTGGLYPLAYKGLGDVFVLIFFGLVAVCGTFYIYTGYLDTFIILTSFIPGILSANILAANNIRDISTDKMANKITLAVRLGEKRSVALYTVMMFVVYYIEFYLFLISGNKLILIAFLTMPLAVIIFRKLVTAIGKEYNTVLALSSLLLILNSILFAMSLIIAT